LNGLVGVIGIRFYPARRLPRFRNRTAGTFFVAVFSARFFGAGVGPPPVLPAWPGPSEEHAWRLAFTVAFFAAGGALAAHHFSSAATMCARGALLNLRFFPADATASGRNRGSAALKHPP